MDEFLIRALVAGLGVAVVAGPLGCFVVWRRMAYFGDTLAHGALLGIGLGLATELGATAGIVVVCALLALLLAALHDQRLFGADTMLGILSHSALAVGLVALAFLTDVRVDLMAYLFGDILAVDLTDIAWIYGGGAAALALLLVMWRPLLHMTVNEELAQVEGEPVARVRLGFMLLMALVVAVAMKVVGVLLITAMLIIPAATARRFAATPEAMAALAAIFGAVAVAAGLGGSFAFDIPSGPSVVVAAAGLFVLAQAAGSMRRA